MVPGATKKPAQGLVAGKWNEMIYLGSNPNFRVHALIFKSRTLTLN